MYIVYIHISIYPWLEYLYPPHPIMGGGAWGYLRQGYVDIGLNDISVVLQLSLNVTIKDQFLPP